MSYYLDMLEKKGMKLKHEQIATRNALRYAVKSSSIRKNKLNAEMDELIAREFDRRKRKS